MQIELHIVGDTELDAKMARVLTALVGDAPAKPESPAPAKPEVEKKPEAANPEPEAKPKAVQEAPAEPSPASEPEKAPAEKPEPEADFGQLAKAASNALNAGKREGFAALLETHGVKKLSEIAEEDYPTVLAEIEAL